MSTTVNVHCRQEEMKIEAENVILGKDSYITVDIEIKGTLVILYLSHEQFKELKNLEVSE